MDNFLRADIQLHLIWVLLIALIYVVIHNFRDKKIMRTLDVILNYIPVLTHEFGHILFNKISGGRASDLVIVAKPSERRETGRQGFAVTYHRGRLNQIITTVGGYFMPPLMLYLGFLLVNYQFPSFFITAYLLIFAYFTLITSRKGIPFLIMVLLIAILAFMLHKDSLVLMEYIVSVVQHYILGVLFGEVIQSTWTIIHLTFSKHKTDWDGSALKSLTLLPTTTFSCIWVIANIYTLYLVARMYI